VLSKETIREVNSAWRLDHHKNKRCGRRGENEKSQQISLGVSGIEEKFFLVEERAFRPFMCVFVEHVDRHTYKTGD
jgi:hypothetical protein